MNNQRPAVEISPALTPDEWAKVRAEEWDGDNRAGRVAAANYALPDDSPHKITAADVRSCREVAGRLREDGYMSEDIEALAAKLAALLPPR